MSCYDHDMGNTVGSASVDLWNLTTKEDAYIAGLWCADGYHRTSSIGISTVTMDFVEEFKTFFLKMFPKDRIKIRVYEPDHYKRRQRAYHCYVNSRPLLRKFREIKINPQQYISPQYMSAYFAGRFDGDGSVARDFYSDCRIVYGMEKEAHDDWALLHKNGFIKSKVYRYAAARTYCLYVSRLETESFLSWIYPHSLRLYKSTFAPRRDCSIH